MFFPLSFLLEPTLLFLPFPTLSFYPFYPFSALSAFYPSFLPSVLYLGLLDTSSRAETESKPEMVSAFMEQVV